MSIAKVHNFKGLSKFERVGGKKRFDHEKAKMLRILNGVTQWV